MRMMWMMSLLASACAIEEGPDDELESTEQSLSNYWAFSYSSETSLYGFNTSLSDETKTCVLSGVYGDLGEGLSFQSTDVASYAGTKPDPYGTFRVYAHGGAYTNQTNDRVWANNPVQAKAACFPYPHSAYGLYQASGLPKKLAPLATGRRCFLNSITGGGQVFTHDGDFVRVRIIGVFDTDETHPTTGWYVEGNLKRNQSTGMYAYAGAYCIDFPSITNEWVASVSSGSEVVTDGTGYKACGLTKVEGAFNVESYSNGVGLTNPTTAAGQWTLTASSGKSASVRCVE